MNETETEAYLIIKRKKIKGASALAKEMDISRQHANRIVNSLKDQGKVTFQPARLLAK